MEGRKRPRKKKQEAGEAQGPDSSPGKDRHGPHKMLRVPLDLYNELQEVADLNERPVTWEGRIALRNHVQAERRKRKPPNGA